MDSFREFPVDAPLPASDPVRTRLMWLISSREDRNRRFPLLADAPMAHEAHAVLPLLFGDRALGAVIFAFTDARTFDDEDRRFLLAIASQAAQALERARLNDIERDVAQRQQ